MSLFNATCVVKAAALDVLSPVLVLGQHSRAWIQDLLLVCSRKLDHYCTLGHIPCHKCYCCLGCCSYLSLCCYNYTASPAASVVLGLVATVSAAAAAAIVSVVTTITTIVTTITLLWLPWLLVQPSQPLSRPLS